MKETKAQKKIGKVMKEFKAGELHSGKGGKVVKNPKQAIAIALSEAGKTKKMAVGGFIEKGGAPNVKLSPQQKYETRQKKQAEIKREQQYAIQKNKPGIKGDMPDQAFKNLVYTPAMPVIEKQNPNDLNQPTVVPEGRFGLAKGGVVKKKTTKMAKGGTPEKWIQGAIKKPGALRKAMGVKEGEKIPAKELAKAAKAPGKMGQRARLAQTLKKMK